MFAHTSSSSKSSCSICSASIFDARSLYRSLSISVASSRTDTRIDDVSSAPLADADDDDGVGSDDETDVDAGAGDEDA